ncbi:MAG: hypothetical protein PWP49_918 [Thermococcaceae archaeon]|jgi:predicted transcriptional regulator|uniref:DUF4443 domain-containing protein n=1 Tax=Thermococcus sp. 101 C5 TaxID=2654197 RepID=UPI00128BAFD4|nr:DUF4443 domain-containing protein [Thermococcus sp. 101 C5]MDK2982526.1 hypothetical protein [Thermococcaceae archaeon]MDN5320498.1 hypothetical protein [Thermococcaceae archaeon]MPW38879.1 DUF4443 domain-containing protein [Thermococcus sp. 101 C5]
MDWKRGAYPEFKIEDAVAVLFLLKTPKGRKQISEELNLGEGTVRTLLKKLSSIELVESQQKGHLLSEKGIKVLQEISKLFSEPLEVTPVEGFVTYALAVKNPPEFRSIELRDEAIRFFAKGAMILTVQNGEIVFPEDGRPLKETLPELSDDLKKLPVENGDLVIVTWAENKADALKSLIHVALNLKGELLPEEIKKLIE